MPFRRNTNYYLIDSKQIGNILTVRTIPAKDLRKRVLKYHIMKKYGLFIISVLLFSFYSCRSRINQMHEPVNSTASGDFSTATNGNDQGDTLSPAQPNALDTTGEQTGRMNKTLAIPLPTNTDTGSKVKAKK